MSEPAPRSHATPCKITYGHVSRPPAPKQTRPHDANHVRSAPHDHATVGSKLVMTKIKKIADKRQARTRRQTHVLNIAKQRQKDPTHDRYTVNGEQPENRAQRTAYTKASAAEPGFDNCNSALHRTPGKAKIIGSVGLT